MRLEKGRNGRNVNDTGDGPVNRDPRTRLVEEECKVQTSLTSEKRLVE